MRRLLMAGVVLLGLALIWSQLAQVQLIFETLQRGNLLWLLLAVGVQQLWLINTTLTYRVIYRLLDMRVASRHLLPLVVTSNFINVATPSAGMGGMAIFISDARRQNLSTPRVTIAGVLFVLFDYFGFLCVLALGLLVLFRRGRLNPAEIAAAMVLVATALTLAGVLFLGARSGRRLEHLLVWGARTINRALFPLLRRPYLSEERAHKFACEAAEGLRALRADWHAYLLPAALSLSGKALLIAILFLTFLAFEQPVTVGTLIAGFSMAFLFMIVSPTPSGVGVVETVLPSALTVLRVPAGTALVIALAYRGLTFWLPFAYGFVTLRILEQRWGKPVERESN